MNNIENQRFIEKYCFYTRTSILEKNGIKVHEKSFLSEKYLYYDYENIRTIYNYKYEYPILETITILIITIYSFIYFANHKFLNPITILIFLLFSTIIYSVFKYFIFAKYVGKYTFSHFNNQDDSRDYYLRSYFPPSEELKKFLDQINIHKIESVIDINFNYFLDSEKTLDECINDFLNLDNVKYLDEKEKIHFIDIIKKNYSKLKNDEF